MNRTWTSNVAALSRVTILIAMLVLMTIIAPCHPAYAIDIVTLSYSENFDSIGTLQTATLPTDWKADKNDSSVRSVGTYSSAGTATTQRAGNSMSSSATNGIYNYGAGAADSATDRAVGFLSSSGGTKSGNLYAKFTNKLGKSLMSITISYDVEKYRNGSNSAGFRVQMYYSTDGSTWTSAGSDFLTSFSADTDNNGYASAPGSTTAVSAKTLTFATPIGDNSDFYLAWNYSVTSSTTTSNAQGLGIDNFQITGGVLPVRLASLAAVAAPGRVTVRWETASEADTLGFNLYRADAGGAWTQVNAAMIASQAPGSPSGYSYRYDDATAARGATYRYRLAAVGMDGGETPLDAVSVTTPVGWYWLPVVGW